MRFEARWLWQGHFNFSDQDSFATTTQVIRDELTRRLGRGTGKLQIAQYPVGPQFKHTFWWREGDRDYAEAQFFARVSGSHPVLSLGVSVEKGLEDLTDIVAAKREAYRMERKSWDWSRLLKSGKQLFAEDIPASAGKVGRPVSVRIVSHRPPRDESRRSTRTFVSFEGRWFERHVGAVDVKEALAHLGELDRLRDWWVVVYIGCDLAPNEVEGMEPVQAADMLMSFANVRDRMRK